MKEMSLFHHFFLPYLFVFLADVVVLVVIQATHKFDLCLLAVILDGHSLRIVGNLIAC
jgi:hypothetical protein